MFGGNTRLRSDERGEVGLGILMAVTFTFVVSVSIIYAFVYLYGQAVMRSAVDEGVRAGSRVGIDQVAVCQAAAQLTLDDLIPGRLGDDISAPQCFIDADGLLVATVEGAFGTPLPGSPAWTIRLSASATPEGQEP